MQRKHRHPNSILSLIAATAFMLAACGDDNDDDGFGSHPQGVGNRCQLDGECTTGICYIGPGGGYCTSPCSIEGDTSACPVDTVCKPIQGGDRRCLLVCGSETSCGYQDDCEDTTCPSGSSCVAVDGTPSLACEPDPA